MQNANQNWSGTYPKGCLRDAPDERDLLFKPFLSPDELPKKASWLDNLSPVLDQSTIGSCVGNGTSGADYALRAMLNMTPVLASRLKIYFDARDMEGTIDQDAGCMIRDAVKALSTLGFVPETEWPYDITKFAQRPPAAVYDDGKKHLLLKYERVDVNNIDHLKAALVRGCVIFGMDLFSSFESDKVAHTGKVPIPKSSEQEIGGHCQLAFGFGNKDSKMIDVRNSWSASWGDSGNCHIPFELFERYANDAWQLELVQN